MTEDEGEAVFERCEEISAAVHRLVDQMTADLPQELDEITRQRLTEEFRFWRRRAGDSQ